MKKIFLLLFMAGLTLFACKETQNLESKDCVEVVGDPCVCTQDYAPVCGCNGKTYPNKCNAECVGIMEYTDGECPE